MTSIIGVDLVINGHVFTVDEIGSIYIGSYTFGGITGERNTVYDNTNDYIVIEALMAFSSAMLADSLHTFNVTLVYTELASQVLEPGSLALLLAGVADLESLRRRNR